MSSPQPSQRPMRPVQRTPFEEEVLPVVQPLSHDSQSLPAPKSSGLPQGTLDLVNHDCVQKVVAAGPNTGAARQNIPVILETMGKAGITNPAHAAYILGTAEQESRFGHVLEIKKVVEEKFLQDPFVKEENPLRYSARQVQKTFLLNGLYEDPDPYTLEGKALVDYFNKKYGGNSTIGNRGKNTDDGWNYRGQGFGHLTGRGHYEAWDAKLAVLGISMNSSLAENPSSAADPHVAATVLVYGMRDGVFPSLDKRKDGSFFYNERSAVRLSDVPQDENFFYNARKVVNAGELTTNPRRVREFEAAAKKYHQVLSTKPCWKG